MKKILFVLAILSLLVSCKKIRVKPCPDCYFLYFENPQPDNDSELDRFPYRFRGIYKSEDSTFLKIDEDRIMVKYFGISKIHKTELDSMRSEFLIYKNKIIRKHDKEIIYISKKGDSLELLDTFIDTIFRFSYYQKAKKIDGKLILSTKDSIFWDIDFLSLENNSLKLKDIYLPSDLKKLDSVTKIKAEVVDSISYLVKPTRNEFKKILKIKSFGSDQEYKKVNYHTW